jgi:predicted AAA+ superfamily ATPase
LKLFQKDAILSIMNETFNPNAGENYIKRPLYINKFLPFLEKNIIKVLVGQRRVGKSYMLFQIMDRIREMENDPEIIFINMEHHSFHDIKDYNDLILFVRNQKKSSGKCFLFIDEIQEIDNFVKGLRSLLSEGKYDIYVTGSNAQMLSGEIATLLAGRSIEIKIYSLSYTEFLLFHKLKDSDDALTSYMKFGGLPYLINLKLEETIVFDYLHNIYNSILYRDIVSRYAIRNTRFLEKLVEFLARNTGSILSAKRISDFLKNQKTDVSPQVVLHYISYLRDAFFIFKVDRFDVKGKKIFEIGEKYYFEDLGLRHTIIGFSLKDINKIIENLIFSHMILSGYTVMAGKSGDREIDFVCEKNQETIYIQAVYLISGDDVFNREFGNLLAINDNFRKIVVSMDPVRTGEKGIEHLHLREFLLKEW